MMLHDDPEMDAAAASIDEHTMAAGPYNPHDRRWMTTKRKALRSLEGTPEDQGGRPDES